MGCGQKLEKGQGEAWQWSWGWSVRKWPIRLSGGIQRAQELVQGKTKLFCFGKVDSLMKIQGPQVRPLFRSVSCHLVAVEKPLQPKGRTWKRNWGLGNAKCHTTLDMVDWSSQQLCVPIRRMDRKTVDFISFELWFGLLFALEGKVSYWFGQRGKAHVRYPARKGN